MKIINRRKKNMKGPVCCSKMKTGNMSWAKTAIYTILHFVWDWNQHKKFFQYPLLPHKLKLLSVISEAIMCIYIEMFTNNRMVSRQVRSLDLLTCSPARYHCAMAAPLRLQKPRSKCYSLFINTSGNPCKTRNIWGIL